MDAVTRKALEGSIRKWRGILAGTTADDGVTNCPLCAEFYSISLGCHGCPVSAATGHSFCRGSPYEKWEDQNSSRAMNKKLRALAKAELDFLISLRPKRARAA